MSAKKRSGFQPRKPSGPRVNEQIKVPEVRLIGDNGDQYGVVGIQRAAEIADEQGLDLVEVSPNAKPPVVKLIDYGKFKYQQQKKAAEAKKKQVTINVKEVKFRPAIDIHDLQTKLKKVHKFLEQGDKVKMLMQFRGREMAHKEIGLGKFNEIIKGVVDETDASVEAPVKMMGNRAIAMLAPSKKK
ncbi:MAG: translation initiation factor IF-3 [Peredibacter sp.]|nr:translation initiation factor IF-3 [Peredibacter sp.]